MLRTVKLPYWIIKSYYYSIFISLLYYGVQAESLNNILFLLINVTIIIYITNTFKNNKIIISANKWIVLYLILLVILHIVSANTPLESVRSIEGFDPIRYNQYAYDYVVNNSGTSWSLNNSGQVWIAILIFKLFGTSTINLAILNASLIYLSVLFLLRSVCYLADYPYKLQWMRFIIFFPDLLFYSNNIGKEILCFFLMSSFILLIMKIVLHINSGIKPVLLLLLILVLTASVRTGLLVLMGALTIYIMIFTKSKKIMLVLALLILTLYGGHTYNNKFTNISDSPLFKVMQVQNYVNYILNYLELDQRKIAMNTQSNEAALATSTGSFNTLAEHSIILIPFKSIALMFGPIPYNLDIIGTIFDYFSTNSSNKIRRTIYEISAIILLLTAPYLISSFFVLYGNKKKIWLLSVGMLILSMGLISVGSLGFIDTRYRINILPVWFFATAVYFVYGTYYKHIKVFLLIISLAISLVASLKLFALIS